MSSTKAINENAHADNIPSVQPDPQILVNITRQLTNPHGNLRLRQPMYNLRPPIVPQPRPDTIRSPIFVVRSGDIAEPKIAETELTSLEGDVEVVDGFDEWDGEGHLQEEA